ncbi:hypothetical protein IJI28_00405 [Candidatus Saccharibacteria bacterium]|nr:hypothetical protein [Candidatus Saccharibacteria bacterium]
MFFKKGKELQPPELRPDMFSSPLGLVFSDERKDCISFKFYDQDIVYRVKVKGDLIQIRFNLLGGGSLKKHLAAVLWLLTNEDIRHRINPKFGNKPHLKFTAAQYTSDDPDGRSCIFLPEDTLETALERFERVWYQQAPVSGYINKLARLVKD